MPSPPPPPTGPITRPDVTFLRERKVKTGESVRRTFGPNATSTARNVWCPWADQDDALIRHIGTQRFEFDTLGQIVGLRRLTPLPDPANPYLYHDELSRTQGHQVSGKVTEDDGSVSALYTNADLEFVMRPRPYPVVADDELTDDDGNLSWPDGEWRRFTSYTDFAPSCEVLTLPGGSVNFIRKMGTTPPHTLTVPHGPGKVLPLLAFKATVHSVPYQILDPLDTVTRGWTQRVLGTATTRPYLGMVNKTKLLGFQAGTLLFDQFRPIPRFGVFGERLYDLEFSFVWKPTRWNFLYYHTTEADKAGWYFVGRGSTHYEPGVDALPNDYSLYSEFEMRDLWRFHLPVLT